MRAMVLMAVIAVNVLGGCGPRIPTRPHQQTVMQAPPGIEVEFKPDALVAWIVRAKNLRPTPIRLLWDESTFVDASGRSYGRLIRGSTKVIDETKPQLATVIVPDSFIFEWCIPEFLSDRTVKTKSDGGRDYSDMDPVRKGVGRMVLVFETDGGKRETWEGALSFDGSQPKPRPAREVPTPVTPPAQPLPVAEPPPSSQGG